MNAASALPPSPATLADTLVRRAYGRDFSTLQDWLAIEPWYDVAAEALVPSAQRIARNALAATSLVTDSAGVMLTDIDGFELGRLWSVRGDERWLSAFCSPSRDPEVALQEWLAWAHRGHAAPRHRITLVDMNVPVISPSIFGARSNRQPTPGPFESLHAASYHAAVVSLVETCVLQRRNPTGFLTDLLAKELGEAICACDEVG